MGTQQFKDDKQIIEAIRAGGIQKERCMNHLFRIYRQLVFRGQNRYKLNATDAKEVYFDSLLALVAAIDTARFKGESKISTYLFRVFENRCKNKVRDAMRYRARYEWVFDIPGFSDDAYNVLDKLIKEEQMEWLDKVLEELGGKCKEILMLSEFMGYSMEEIAEKLNIGSAGAVTSTKYRCMQKIKSIIEKGRFKSFQE